MEDINKRYTESKKIEEKYIEKAHRHFKDYANGFEDISNEVTDKFYDTFKKGDVLGYQLDGKLSHYKIVRLDKKRKIVKVMPTTLYTEEEFNDKMKSDAIQEGEVV